MKEHPTNTQYNMYQEPSGTLYLGDCREVLKALAAESIDMVINRHVKPMKTGYSASSIEP